MARCCLAWQHGRVTATIADWALDPPQVSILPVRRANSLWGRISLPAKVWSGDLSGLSVAGLGNACARRLRRSDFVSRSLRQHRSAPAKCSSPTGRPDYLEPECMGSSSLAPVVRAEHNIRIGALCKELSTSQMDRIERLDVGWHRPACSL